MSAAAGGGGAPVSPAPSGADTAPPLDVDRVGAWLGAPVRFLGVVSRGASKATWSATVGGVPAFVAVPPPGALLATAHDLQREHRFLAALEGSEVPVPRVLAFCPDADVAGRPFLITERVEGRCLLVDPAQGVDAAAVADAALDVLVALHRLDVSRLGEPLPTGSHLERQIRRWQTQLEATPTAARLGDLTPIVTWLLANRPAHEDRTIVHGDFGLHNLLVGRDRVTAVLDWELATVGDPLVDLTGFLKSWGAGAAVPNAANDAIALDPAAPTREELGRRYEARSGRAVGRHARFYEVLARWRSIGIQEGIHARSEGSRFTTEVPRLVAAVRGIIGLDPAPGAPGEEGHVRHP